MNEIDEAPDEFSRQKRKNEVEAWQHAGERLIKLSEAQLKQLELPEEIYDAVIEAKRLTSNGAIRRQRQYIGRLMREDEDPDGIVARLQALEGSARNQVAKLHMIERWRDRLLADEEVLGELIDAYPEVDTQRVRTLIRNAQKELAQAKPPKSSRELFALLRELML
ncbi:ribosome biogenesis factor YjgA [Thiofilum flexile]|uniref:ribosome biogenesis factor YjgA n=1 Tax=Thiofilum flexile TaxID=125627 RepID=UPI000371D83E|nr:ribosome biogenesis factor YjgA [Thiofilum flexile]